MNNNSNNNNERRRSGATRASRARRSFWSVSYAWDSAFPHGDGMRRESAVSAYAHADDAPRVAPQRDQWTGAKLGRPRATRRPPRRTAPPSRGDRTCRGSRPAARSGTPSARARRAKRPRAVGRSGRRARARAGRARASAGIGEGGGQRSVSRVRLPHAAVQHTTQVAAAPCCRLPAPVVLGRYVTTCDVREEGE